MGPCGQRAAGEAQRLSSFCGTRQRRSRRTRDVVIEVRRRIALGVSRLDLLTEFAAALTARSALICASYRVPALCCSSIQHRGGYAPAALPGHIMLIVSINKSPPRTERKQRVFDGQIDVVIATVALPPGPALLRECHPRAPLAPNHPVFRVSARL